MTLREKQPSGKETVYPDDGVIARSELSHAFGCSQFAIDRLFKRGRINPVEIQREDGDMQEFMRVSDFPKLVETVKEGRGPQKLKSHPRNTSGTFEAKNCNWSCIYLRTSPKIKPLSKIRQIS